jgi:hypothetical protein
MKITHSLVADARSGMMDKWDLCTTQFFFSTASKMSNKYVPFEFPQQFYPVLLWTEAEPSQLA